MVDNPPAYRSDESWQIDEDGVQYDTNKFRRNGDLLDVHRTNGARGFVRISSAVANMVTHQRDNRAYYPENGELRDDDDHFIMMDKNDEIAGESARVVVAIPVDLVDRPEYAYETDEQDIIAAQRHLREAFHHIDDAQLKLKEAYPDQQAALATVHQNLKIVLASIEDRRNSYEQWELSEAVSDLIEQEGIGGRNQLGIDGRPDGSEFDSEDSEDDQE